MQTSFYEKDYMQKGVAMPTHCLLMKFNNPVIKKDWKPHHHKYIELLYSFQSDSLVYIDGEVIPFKTGDMIIINTQKGHDLQHRAENTLYYVIKVLPEILYNGNLSIFEMKYVLPFLTDGFGKVRFLAKEIGNDYVRQLVTEIWEETKTADYGHELVIRADILKLFFWILRYAKANNLLESDNLDLSDENLQVIRTALAYVAENYAYLNEEMVAKYCGLSYHYFSRLFKRLMKQSFSAYINDYRLEKAQQLLLNSDKTVEEIALDLGFCTASYFIYKFKKKYLVSPKQYRLKTIKATSNDITS